MDEQCQVEQTERESNKQWCKNIDRKKLLNLIVGAIGIIVTFSISGIFVQLIVKHEYLNRFTGKYQLCKDYFGYNFIHSFYIFAMGNIFIVLFVRKKNQSRENERIPFKYAALSGLTMFAGNIFTMNAVHQTSFAVITVFKACSVLSVILVGVFCTRVRDQRLKLGKEKILGAFVITCCILIFQFFDPETKDRTLKAQFLGILFLLGTVSADGFYPDFQAKIKTQNPILQPLAMMVKIHLVMFTLSIISQLIQWQLISYFVFMYEHPLYILHLFGQICFSFFGQIFVYRMIKQFKQHVVPFTVTTRKIMSVFWSILFFGHPTNWIQILSVFGLLAVVCWQFKVQISKDPINILQKDPIDIHKDSIIDDTIESEDKINASLLSQTNQEELIQSNQQSTEQNTQNYIQENKIIQQIKEQRI